MTKFLQTLIDAIAVGSLYALIALGYTMVYGTLKFINFAHSSIFMLGAWFSCLLTIRLGKHYGWFADGATPPPLYMAVLILLTAMALCALLSFFIELLAYRPLRSAPRLNVLITAIGVSLLLENVSTLRQFLGTQPARMPQLLPEKVLANIVGVEVHLADVLIVVAALAIMGALQFLVYGTKLGTAMRAVSQDIRTASLMGININRTVSITFVVGSALAGAAGFLFANKYPGINQPAHSTWVLLGLKAFVAAVVGGIGNIRGAMLGGILIGVIEMYGAAYLSPQMRDIYVFAILILVLLVRPNGIMGKLEMEKV